jgi:surface protein
MHKESLLNFNNIGILLKTPLNKYINDILNKNCKNEINMKIRIEEKDINKNIYILYGNTNIVESYRSSGRFSSYCYLDSEKEINKLNNTNVELFINNIRYDYNNYFKAEKEGIFDVKLKFLSKIENCSKLFCGCGNITHIDLSFFDSSNIMDTSYMFTNCINLETIDFSSFDTKNVINMKYMFKGCNNLTNVNLSFFNTKNVKYMNHMFEGCSNLKDIYLSSFDTINVTDMSCMFANCINLSNLDLSSFETVNVTCMECMFYNCCSLSNINISSFDTINVINADNLFGCCYNLSIINLNSFKRLFINKKMSQNCINLLL